MGKTRKIKLSIYLSTGFIRHVGLDSTGGNLLSLFIFTSTSMAVKINK